MLGGDRTERAFPWGLRQSGQQVWCIVEMEQGISDDAVVGLAKRGAAGMVTADENSGELVFRQGGMRRGVIVIRLAGSFPSRKAGIVRTGRTRRHPGRGLRSDYSTSPAYPTLGNQLGVG